MNANKLLDELKRFNGKRLAAAKIQSYDSIKVIGMTITSDKVVFATSERSEFAALTVKEAVKRISQIKNKDAFTVFAMKVLDDGRTLISTIETVIPGLADDDPVTLAFMPVTVASQKEFDTWAETGYMMEHV